MGRLQSQEKVFSTKRTWNAASAVCFARALSFLQNFDERGSPRYALAVCAEFATFVIVIACVEV